MDEKTKDFTKYGYKLLHHHDRIKIKPSVQELSEPENLQDLEYWTEEELENLKKNRN